MIRGQEPGAAVHRGREPVRVLIGVARWIYETDGVVVAVEISMEARRVRERTQARVFLDESTGRRVVQAARRRQVKTELALVQEPREEKLVGALVERTRHRCRKRGQEVRRDTREFARCVPFCEGVPPTRGVDHFLDRTALEVLVPGGP